MTGEINQTRLNTNEHHPIRHNHVARRDCHASGDPTEPLGKSPLSRGVNGCLS